MTRKTTSLKIDPELWKEVKKYCIDKGVNISDWMEMLINGELKKKKKNK